MSVYIYEAADKIGGRVSTTRVKEKRFEAGASIIHSRNEYASTLVKKLNLTKRKSSSANRKSLGSLTGIYNGTDCVFKESSNHYVTLFTF